ncbi:hypothetical protein GCM10010495_46760 [Kitasatospora herbaricolor]|nr:hypothetical protein GCM10010495_46760 [Kitasatospora herbaricolor]
MPLGVLVHQVGEVTAARYLVEGRKAEVEQDCSSFATLRDARTLLPSRRVRPEGSAPVFEASHLGRARPGRDGIVRMAPYGRAGVTCR